MENALKPNFHWAEYSASNEPTFSSHLIGLRKSDVAQKVEIHSTFKIFARGIFRRKLGFTADYVVETWAIGFQCEIFELIFTW